MNYSMKLILINKRKSAMISSNWQVDIWDWELVTGNTLGPTETIYQDHIHHSRDRQVRQ